MARGRKTFDVETMRKFANEQLQRVDKWTSEQERWGVIHMIEKILGNSANYTGFRYLTNQELPENVRPGVRNAPNGDVLDYEKSFENTDETRRYYF